jgi:hypothetical protein
VQLIARLANTIAIVRVNHEDDTLSVLVVCEREEKKRKRRVSETRRQTVRKKERKKLVCRAFIPA